MHPGDCFQTWSPRPHVKTRSVLKAWYVDAVGADALLGVLHYIHCLPLCYGALAGLPVAEGDAGEVPLGARSTGREGGKAGVGKARKECVRRRPPTPAGWRAWPAAHWRTASGRMAWGADPEARACGQSPY